MPIAPVSPDSPAAELSTIDRCLAGIRRRIYLLRLTERLVIALAWGGAVGVCLTGARLLHNGAIRFDITAPGWGWCALLLALVPLAMAAWATRQAFDLRRKPVNGVTTITPALAFIAAGITAGCSVAGIVLLFVHAGGALPAWVVPVFPIGVLLIVAGASVRMIDQRAAAIFVDLQVGLHERVSTALEMLNTPAQSTFEKSFRAPVIASAVEACQQVAAALQSRSSRIRFHRLDQRAYAAAALAALAAAGVTLFRPLPAQARPTHQVSVVTINQAKQLEKVMQELEKNKPPTDKTDQHLQPLKDAIARLQDGKMSDIEKAAVLSEAKEKMKQDEDAMKAADKAQEALRSMEQTQDLAKAADDMKKSEIAKNNGEANAGNQAGDNLKKAASDMANKIASGNADDRKKAADALKAAADKAGADPQLQKSLNNAASAAASGDAQKLSQNLNDAGQRMGDQGASAQSNNDDLNRAMSEIDRLQNQSGGQSTMADNNSGGSGNGNTGGNDQKQDGGNGEQSAKGNANKQQPGGGNPIPGDQQGKGTDAGSNQPGAGSEQPGNGSTMMEARGGPSPDQGPVGGVGSFVRIYGEQSTKTSGSTEKVGSKINPLGGPASGSVDVMGPADKNDPAFKTFAEALTDAHQRAMDELSRQDIPPQYQDMVKDFYEDKK